MRSLGWAYGWIAFATLTAMVAAALGADVYVIALNAGGCTVIGTTIGLSLGRNTQPAERVQGEAGEGAE